MRGFALPDIFDEVEEDLRAERARQMAKRWGGLALAAALAVVVATGGWQAWRWNEGRQAAAAAQTYLNLHQAAEREGADLAAAAGGFAALGREAPSGYATLAKLRAAALRAETGDRAGATALWDEVSRDGGADRSTATSPPCYRSPIPSKPAIRRRSRPASGR
jgi:hypothetical protein